MCGIAGFYNFEEHYMYEKEKWTHLLNQMNLAQKRRGPDDEGTYLSDTCGLAHVRLKIVDFKTGAQPMIRKEGSRECAIVFNGEIYNMHQLKSELLSEGATFRTASDTEVLLTGYMLHGKEYIKKLNGIFSIALYDSFTKQLLLVRDRLGVKPLFYTKLGNTLVFASELKGLFSYPGVKAQVDSEGLCEIFALGPARTPGLGVFKNISEVLPGHWMIFDRETQRNEAYWSLESHPHEDSFEDTLEKTGALVEDAVKLQMMSDVPISTFLSGGLDSSLVTAICAKELQKQGKVLDTFSFDFSNNHKYFSSNTFQPSEDRPYAEAMAAFAKTNHRFLECTNEDLVTVLYQAVDARDLPCMADIESSMLYFCSQVTDYNKVTLTGECADEIFGGYPWFHDPKAFAADAFPWSPSMEPRKMLLSKDFLSTLPLKDYARAAYEKAIAETPILPEESPLEKRRREIAYLNLRWFMATLLERMDRTSMYNGLEARVPFADYRIVEYMFNVPWEMKCPNGVPKGLLRQVGEGLLPKEIVYRKKSPYPKTYDPSYEQLLGARLREVLSDVSAPIVPLLDAKKVEAFLTSPSDYGKPWYGQLMAGPQMIAYLLQINYWLQRYHIEIC